MSEEKEKLTCNCSGSSNTFTEILSFIIIFLLCVFWLHDGTFKINDDTYKFNEEGFGIHKIEVKK